MKKVHIVTEAQKTGDKISGKISLEGELTLINAQEIKTKLYEALKKYQVLKVSVQNVLSLDLSTIQLLYALSKTAGEMKKAVTFTIVLPPEIEPLLRKAGFRSLLENQVSFEHPQVQ
jgi:anti-anti-sigma regulatory factor